MTAQAGSAAPPFLLAGGTNAERALIRTTMRARRANLSRHERQRAALKIARHLSRSLLLRPGKRVAIYIAIRGEVSLEPVVRLARKRGCMLYLPQIANFAAGTMDFIPFSAQKHLTRNRLGLFEYRRSDSRPLSPRRLDFVLTPLVAFDARGWRLGMGAGFYDRHFSFLRTRTGWRRPKLIGIAYAFQEVASLTPQPWDVPLDAVVTERGLRWLDERSELV